MFGGKMLSTGVFLALLIVISQSKSFSNRVENDDSSSVDADDYEETENAPPFYEYLSVCYNKTANTLYTLAAAKCDSQVALGRYRNSINETGWALLEVETRSEFEPEIQAYAAGYAEGHLTKQLIYYHFKNTVENMCINYTGYCNRLRDYLTANLNWTREQVLANPITDIYWRQVNLTYTQLTGIYHGYREMDLRPSVSFTINPVYMLQLPGERFDLDKLLNKTRDPNDDPEPGRCSGFLKIAPGNKDMFFAQTSMSSFSWMIRILKLYKFAYDKQTVPGYAASFSSYPGCLASMDDYTLLSSGLGSIETTISVYNKTLYSSKFMKPEGQLACWLRSVIANRLARTAHEWVKIFARYNSGTYNNQWTVVDYKKFTPGQPLPKRGLVWVLEQIPGTTMARDVTWFVRQRSYWPSYNIPFLKKISKKSGFDAQGAKYDWYKWGASPRAKIFERDHNKVVDIDTLTKLMRYNDYTHDEFSKCQCNPPYTAEAGISARGDLNPANGTYLIEGMGHRDHGGLDTKTTNYTLFQKLRIHAWGGPTYDPLPVFSWDTTDLKNVRHFGQPTVWNFTWTETNWEADVSVDP